MGEFQDNQRILCIGAGNMGGALLYAMLKQGNISPGQLSVVAPHGIKHKALAEYAQTHHIPCFETLEQAYERQIYDLVFLGVKPHLMQELCCKYAKYFQGAVLVSMAVGLNLSLYRSWVPKALAVVRIMPNVLIEYACGTVAYSCEASANKELGVYMQKLFKGLGLVQELAESQMELVSVMAGSAPAFWAEHVHHMVRQAISEGMNAETAQIMVALTMMGTAQSLLFQDAEQLAVGFEPQELVKRVCSPAGTTIAGILAMEASARQAAESFVTSALKRGREMS